MESNSNGVEVQKPLAPLASWVRLNVGGTIFATTRTTLAKDPSSFLYRCFQVSHVKSYTYHHRAMFLHFSESADQMMTWNRTR